MPRADNLSTETKPPMKQFVSILAAALLAVSLWGCGGGGSSPTDRPDVPQPPPNMPQPPPNMPQPPPDPPPPGGIAAAAANPPLAAESVVQSSTGDAGLSVSVTHAPGGSVDFTVARGTEWSLGSGDEATQTVENRRGQRPSSGLTVTGVVAYEGRSEAEAGVAEGVLLLFLTDIEGADDADFLVWGSWGHAPAGAAVHEDTTEGAFAHGSDPFRAERLAALRGGATYTGDADGRYIDPGLLDSASFNGRVTLQADFGDPGTPGAVAGRVEGLRFYSPAAGEWVPAPAAAVGTRGRGHRPGRVFRRRRHRDTSRRRAPLGPLGGPLLRQRRGRLPSGRRRGHLRRGERRRRARPHRRLWRAQVTRRRYTRYPHTCYGGGKGIRNLHYAHEL